MELNRVSLSLAAVGLVLSTGASAQEAYEVTIEQGVTMKTRDGVTLSADVYRPKAEGKFPVLLERTPYDKHRMTYAGIGFGVKDCLPRLYLHHSGLSRALHVGRRLGPFRVRIAGWLRHRGMGRDTSLCRWQGRPGGHVLRGRHADANSHRGPPHLAGICPVITGSNYHENWTYQGGAFAQSFDQGWTSYFAEDTLVRRARKDTARTHGDMLLPLGEYPVLIPSASSGLADYYLDWLAHPRYDDYWKQWSIEEHFSKIKVPGFHVAAWYDLFQDGSIKNYLGIKAQGGSEAARNNQRLLVMAGGHAGLTSKIGDIDFGKDSVPDLIALTLRWYDYVLKGSDNGLSREKPVKIFVMGKNTWREEDSWPLTRAKAARYYLHSGGKANTLSGDGTLNMSPPASETPDQYVYDPADPVLTRGGPVPRRESPGPVDQRPTESREDVLVYTTSVFQKDTEVTGPVSLELYVSSSAVDTDFTAKLIDVWPNGSAENLLDGISRARYRNSMEKAEFMNPGEVYKLTINLWSTSNVFLAGHKLRLEVSSSNFPRFDRNLNTGEDPESGKRMVKATNHIYHDREYASALVLPIVP